jgi:hypothetical protein
VFFNAKTNQMWRLTIPKNVNFEELCKETKFNNQKSHDLLACFLHTIISRAIVTDAEQYGNWVNLKAEYLKDFDSGYREKIKFLKENSIIEATNSYEARVRSKSYRIDYNYTGDVKTHLVTNSVVKSKLTRLMLNSSSSYVKGFDKRLLKHFSYLKIDTDKARHALVKAFTIELLEQTKNLEHKKHAAVLKKLEETEITWISSLIHMENDIASLNENTKNQNVIKIDNTSYRLHSSLTRIKSILRHYITYNDEHIVSIDIKNSQPYMFAMLLTEEFQKTLEKFKKNKIYKKYNDINNITEIINTNYTPSTLMLQISSVTPDNRAIEENDLLQFTRDVVQGTLYEKIALRFNERISDTSKHIERKKAKELTFNILFRNNQNRSSPIVNLAERAFSKLYPSVFNTMKQLKEKNHKKFSILLQTMESFMVFDVIIPKIWEHNAEIPLFTIHDSIATTEEFADTVHKIMEEEFTGKFGIAPTLKQEKWHPELDETHEKYESFVRK